ncbi:MAG: hypothetical protein EPO35_08665 [Acidobacteria bacterium]|nr:MAG: hypothetical protein EPO35_08665 [Acidobacteriota bacterium]
MAVFAVFTGKGFTKQMYEALRVEVKWETRLAPGGLFHVCGFDAAGDLHVADVWESEEQMNAFVGTRLVPAFQKLGIPMPEVSVFPAHNVNVYPGASRFALK